MSMFYHQGKDNVAENTRSRLSMDSVSHVEEDK